MIGLGRWFWFLLIMAGVLSLSKKTGIINRILVLIKIIYDCIIYVINFIIKGIYSFFLILYVSIINKVNFFSAYFNSKFFDNELKTIASGKQIVITIHKPVVYVTHIWNNICKILGSILDGVIKWASPV